MAELNRQFEALSMEFTKAQSTMNELLEARSKLETQFQENKIVLEEFDYMKDDTKIYKLTGPVLMPQDYNEAKMNVSKRIEFILAEIKRVEDKIEMSQSEMDDARNKLLQVRSQMTPS